jgi:acylphosphatase
MPKKRIAVRVEGRVQGVFFRDYTDREAQRLQLNGWVRNRADGSVEAEVEGEPEQLEAMIAWFHEGSPLSQVTAVHVAEIPTLNEARPFSVRYA